MVFDSTIGFVCRKGYAYKAEKQMITINYERLK
nr:MAG TPA: hypothetical protein [Caudoviricetes sp.]